VSLKFYTTASVARISNAPPSSSACTQKQSRGTAPLSRAPGGDDGHGGGDVAGIDKRDPGVAQRRVDCPLGINRPAMEQCKGLEQRRGLDDAVLDAVGAAVRGDRGVRGPVQTAPLKGGVGTGIHERHAHNALQAPAGARSLEQQNNICAQSFTLRFRT
jgi:hypothetical protein